jgi:predicted acylesterase/phospholipase RssA/CRP-like cAMP-binding protein
MNTVPTDQTLLEELLALRAESAFLSCMGNEDLSHLGNVFDTKKVSAGDVLVKPGDAGEQVWLVLEGRFAESLPGMEANALGTTLSGPGSLIGAAAFFSGGTQKMEVRAETNGRLAVLPRESGFRLLDEQPNTWRHLSAFLLEEQRREQLGDRLDQLFGPFGKLRPYILKEMEDEVEWLNLRGGEMLIKQGEPADDAYILMTGRLRVAVENREGRNEVISEIAAGETVGEIALLTEGVRSATVFAARDSELVRFSRRSFKLMLERSSKAMGSVSRILTNRLVDMIGQAPRPQPAACIALVPVTANLPIDEFTHTVMASMEEFGSVALLSSDAVGKKLGMVDITGISEPHPAHLRLTQWLQEQEAAHRYLIYQTDGSWTHWTERCVRQVDHLIFVGNADERPDLSEMESRIRTPNQRASLVLLHRGDSRRPTGTSFWLSERNVESVYHVRRGHDADYRRLVRILAGQAVSLVLSGGGARGFAQVGVIRALEELGIPVDMVGGTSIGACMSFYHASGMNADEIQSHLRAKWSSMLDYTLPLVALMAGRKINHRIESDCSAWDIEDLWTPFYCVSANLTTSQAMIHNRGNAARAVRATTAIPGVLPPVPAGEDLLIDGGVLNNLPLDIMRRMNPSGPLIAVDVVSPRGPRAKSDFGMWVSGWRAAVNRINPFATRLKLPGVTEVMIRGMLVGADSARNRMLREGLADLYLNINVAGVSMLGFDVVDPTVEKGYRASLEPLREWIRSQSPAIQGKYVE